MTDNEIKKDFVYTKMTDSFEIRKALLEVSHWCTSEYGRLVIQDAIDLINRQKAEADKKDTEIDILIRKKEALNDEISELKAEIERLKDIAKNTLSESVRLCDCILNVKTKAIKEFAERLKAISHPYGDTQMVFELQIDNLVKEMTEGDSNETD